MLEDGVFCIFIEFKIVWDIDDVVNDVCDVVLWVVVCLLDEVDLLCVCK